jgi:hypothetical protein
MISRLPRWAVSATLQAGAMPEGGKGVRVANLLSKCILK